MLGNNSEGKENRYGFAPSLPEGCEDHGRFEGRDHVAVARGPVFFLRQQKA